MPTININENENEISSSVNLPEEQESVTNKKTFTFSALGEIMLGNIDNTSYVLPFASISDIAKDADYTFTSMGTNIVDIDNIENAKSKYVVTKNILKSFNILGIDGVNIANDHIMDFSSKVLDKTKQILSNNDLDVIGLQDDVIYAEHDGIKIAFIGVCNEAIGSYSKYTTAGIWMYDDYMQKIKEAITKAEQKANTVVLITHLGNENSHIVTDVMSWFYHELIDAGADMVLGAHALGVYPIEIYKGKPIIYSLGYLFADTDYEIGKKSGVFKFTIDVEGTVTNMEVTPTYITENGVEKYMEYDSKGATEFLEYISSTSNKYSYNAVIKDGKLNITF